MKLIKSLRKIRIKISLILVLLLTWLYSYQTIPSVFKSGGGSCYNGITATIVELLLLFCFSLSVLSISMNVINWKKTSKIGSVLSLAFWLFWSIAISSDYTFKELMFFFPFCVALIVTMISMFRKETNKDKISR